jgi:dTDP-4-amino-4,6-dideoxygalactose transaminase
MKPASLPLPRPARAIVPHSRPLLGPDEEQAAARVLRSGRLAPGAEAARLESLLARLADCADSVALSSGTLALTLALRALGLSSRDSVAIPSYACAALLYAVRAAGCRPLVCDIDPLTLAIDPRDVARRADADLRVVIVVHPFGLPVRLEPFRARGLLVIEDCCQAPGASDRGHPVGSRGDAAAFSLGPTKMITCGGQGGALASPRAAVVRLARDLAGHDEKNDDRPRVNGLLGDLQAAIGAVQVGRLGEFADRRARIAARYDRELGSLPFTRPQPPADARAVTYRYLLRTPDAGDLVRRLQARGVMARPPVFRPLHRILGLEETFPETSRADREMLSLPIGPALRDEEIERVIEEVLRCRP